MLTALGRPVMGFGSGHQERDLVTASAIGSPLYCCSDAYWHGVAPGLDFLADLANAAPTAHRLAALRCRLPKNFRWITWGLAAVRSHLAL